MGSRYYPDPRPTGPVRRPTADGQRDGARRACPCGKSKDFPGVEGHWGNAHRHFPKGQARDGQRRAIGGAAVRPQDTARGSAAGPRHPLQGEGCPLCAHEPRTATEVAGNGERPHVPQNRGGRGAEDVPCSGEGNGHVRDIHTHVPGGEARPRTHHMGPPEAQEQDRATVQHRRARLGVSHTEKRSSSVAHGPWSTPCPSWGFQGRPLRSAPSTGCLLSAYRPWFPVGRCKGELTENERRR